MQKISKNVNSINFFVSNFQFYGIDKYCKSMHLESLCTNIGSASVSNVNIIYYSDLPPTKYRIRHCHFTSIFEFQALYISYRDICSVMQKCRSFVLIYNSRAARDQ